MNKELYNSICPKCNMPAYMGLTKIECSNPPCELYVTPKVIEVKYDDETTELEFEDPDGCDGDGDCGDCDCGDSLNIEILHPTFDLYPNIDHNSLTLDHCEV